MISYSCLYGESGACVLRFEQGFENERVQIELVVDAKATIGESPSWSEGEAALYWIDVKAPALYCTEVDTRRTASWRLPSDIGGYALKPDESGAILALRTGIFGLDFATGELAKFCDPPFDPEMHRFNESACDSSGRLWLGTMFDPRTQCEPRKQDLYTFTIDGGLVAQNDFALLHNGFAWNADNTEFFVAHSRERRIYAYAFNLEQGSLGRRRVVAELTGNDAVPDGGAVDAIPDGGAVDVEGFYWSAIHGGGCLHRYALDGQLDRIIDLPFARPTMPAFGGPELTDLYVTSATHGKPSAPHEGGVFRLRPGVAGLPKRCCLR